MLDFLSKLYPTHHEFVCQRCMTMLFWVIFWRSIFTRLSAPPSILSPYPMELVQRKKLVYLFLFPVKQINILGVLRKRERWMRKELRSQKNELKAGSKGQAEILSQPLSLYIALQTFRVVVNPPDRSEAVCCTLQRVLGEHDSHWLRVFWSTTPSLVPHGENLVLLH